jgi:hypothetical protein
LSRVDFHFFQAKEKLLNAYFTAKSLFINRTAEIDECAKILDSIIENVLNTPPVEAVLATASSSSVPSSVVAKTSLSVAPLVFFCLRALKYHRVGKSPVTIFGRLFVFF